MTGPLNICVVGAGSSYTPEIVQGLCDNAAALNVASLSLTDIDAGRLDMMAGLTRRMLAHAGSEIDVRISLDRDAMLDGSDFVITQIRVGGMAARHLDESIPPKYGIVGQETTGPGGMFKALRTIPHMLEIARAVESTCPDAYL